jgi:hypothetical protein
MRLIERMPSLYRPRLQLPLSKKISNVCIVGGLFPVSKQCFRSLYHHRHGISSLHRSASASESAPFAGCRHAEMPPLPLAACATPACRRWPRRQTPPGVTAVDGVARQETCRRWGRRQVHAGFSPGGRLHVSPAQTCRHLGMVFFDNFFGRWSFLTIHWCKWSFVSKIHAYRERAFSDRIMAHLALKKVLIMKKKTPSVSALCRCTTSN